MKRGGKAFAPNTFSYNGIRMNTKYVKICSFVKQKEQNIRD